MLQDVITHARKVTRIGFYTSIIGALCAYIYPFSFEERSKQQSSKVFTLIYVYFYCFFSFYYKEFILDIDYFFFDAKQTPFYEFFFLLQALILVPVFIFVYLPFANFLLMSLKFGEVILMDLCTKLRNISNQDEATQLRELKECISYHEKIIT